ncbi:MAG: acetyl-CoA carboxylase biotin carboxyl carrier protein subunit [Ignavibacteriales bacterium]|nr:acetyl-CoA carboxylase biotin carboxyl carrier protein subunit [Ignavibacteriales bacterium]
MEQYKITIGEKIYNVINDAEKIIINGKECNFTETETKNGMIDIHLGKSQHRVYTSFKNNNSDAEVWVGNHIIPLKIEDSRGMLLNRFQKKSTDLRGEVIINAPMPGLVKKIEINKGELVKRDQGLVILEAMKMENEIKSPINGKIKEIKIENNNSVEKDQILIIIDAI